MDGIDSPRHTLDPAAADSGNMVVAAAAVEAPNSHHRTVAAGIAADKAVAAVVAGSIRLVAGAVGATADIPGCPKLLQGQRTERRI